jgi:alpha-ribazole phosphatase
MIYLIRHGITEDNELKLYSGHTNSKLSDKGIKELQTLIEVYKGLDMEIIASPLDRCIHTIEILFDRKPDQYSESLKEMNFGVFEGKSYNEIKDLDDYQYWLENYLVAGPPNGESFNDFKKRVLDYFNTLNNKIIVTHGGVIRLILSELFDLNFFDIEIPNGLGYIIDLENKKYKKIRG